jgi:hypothetical protein
MKRNIFLTALVTVLLINCSGSYVDPSIKDFYGNDGESGGGGSSNSSSIIGTWFDPNHTSETLTFFEDKTVKYYNEGFTINGTYSVSGNLVYTKIFLVNQTYKHEADTLILIVDEADFGEIGWTLIKKPL